MEFERLWPWSEPLEAAALLSSRFVDQITTLVEAKCAVTVKCENCELLRMHHKRNVVNYYGIGHLRFPTSTNIQERIHFVDLPYYVPLTSGLNRTEVIE